MASQLELDGDPISMKITVLDGKQKPLNSRVVDLSLKTLHNKKSFPISACTINSIANKFDLANWNKHKNLYSHLKNILFVPLANRKTVDILIGVDHAELHTSVKEIQGRFDEPVARLTPIGWSCVGPIKRTENEYAGQSFFSKVDFEIDKTLRRFWELEKVEIENENEHFLISEQRKQLRKTSQGYVVKTGTTKSSLSSLSSPWVKIPWKSKTMKIPDSRPMAEKRLLSLKRKLEKNENLALSYKEQINEFEKLDYIREVCNKENVEKTRWFLPHFPVIREEKETTKVRIVFDAAAQCENLCLNDLIHTGPKLQKELFDVLLRFRKNSIAIGCDIQQMFLRIQIDKDDRLFHRFLWFDYDLRGRKVYEFNRVVFGVNASPFLAQFVANENARLNQKNYPRAAETIQKSTYMDDCLDSVESVVEAKQLSHELLDLWKEANMNARKWISNEMEALTDIPEENLGSTFMFEADSVGIKTLGVGWNNINDSFFFTAKNISLANKITKRLVLSTIAKVFDPLGFLAPFVVKGKVLMQDIWRGGYDWDTELSFELQKRFMDWISDLQFITSIKVPRHVGFHSQASETQLHLFSDASKDAYGCVAYLFVQFNDEWKSTLVASKSRVSPLTVVTIPRLELLGAVLAAALALRLLNVFDCSHLNVRFWTDSEIVRNWLRNSASKLKPFVANRIEFILQNFSPQQWSHIPGSLNPADVV